MRPLRVDMRDGGRCPIVGSASNLPNNKLYWCCLSNITVSSFWTRYYKKDFKILCPAPSHCLPSCLLDVMHVTLSARPSPSVFAYYKRSKTGGRNGLGTRLRFLEYWMSVSSGQFIYHNAIHSYIPCRLLWLSILNSIVFQGGVGFAIVPVYSDIHGIAE